MSVALMAQGYLSPSLGRARAGRHTRATASLEGRNRKTGETSFEVGPARKNSIPQGIQHGNWISAPSFLTPHHVESWFSGIIWGCSFIPHKYQRHRWVEGHSRIWQLRSRLGLEPWMCPGHFFSSCAPSAWPVSTVCTILYCWCDM